MNDPTAVAIHQPRMDTWARDEILRAQEHTATEAPPTGTGGSPDAGGTLTRRFAMSIDDRVLLLAGLAILLWGFWGVFGKLALERRMAPTSVFLAEVFTSAVCAVPVLLILWRKPEAAALYTSWNVFGVASGGGLALGLFCYYFALEQSHASILVPLTAIYPAVSVLLSYGLLHERPTVFQWVGVVLVIVGAILLLAGPAANISLEGRQRH